jgi:hypothetical protein
VCSSFLGSFVNVGSCNFVLFPTRDRCLLRLGVNSEYVGLINVDAANVTSPQMISSLGESLLEDRLHEVGVDRKVAISAYLPNVWG